MKDFLSGKKHKAVALTGKIFLINAVLLAALLLLFEPSEKIDDYNIKFILSGAASGQSDGHILGYSNFILGEALKKLTEIISAVPWYEVTQYITLFVSFCVLTYLIWKRGLGKVGNAITLILLAIFGFEAYIKLTFTQTAGIACAAGLFLLFYVLYDTNIKKDGIGKNIIKLIIAISLIVIGDLFRYNMFRLIFGIGIAYIFFCFLCSSLDVKRGDNQIAYKTTAIYLGRTVAVCLLLFCCLYGLNRESNKLFSQDEEWADYSRYNPLKGSLQDYGWPDYEKYKDEYEQLGIDEVMFDFWNQKEYSDPEFYTMDTMRSIIQIKNAESINYVTEIKSFFKEFPNRFFREICFWAIIPLIAYWCASKQRYKKLTLVISLSLLMILNFYQYIEGRYDQHQVNVGIWFAVALIFIMCMAEATGSFKRQKWVIPAAAIFLIGFVSVNYNYLTSDNYWGAGDNRKVDIDQVQSFLVMASNDEDHLYVNSFDDRAYGFKGYSVFEQIPAGLYHNIYCTQDYMIPSSRVSLDNYGVYNVYREMVDSDVIYYYESAEVPKSVLDNLEAYIQDLYNDTAKRGLVKQIGGISVYGIFSDSFQLDTGSIVDITPSDDSIFSDVTITIVLDDLDNNKTPEVTTEVSGYIYKLDTNSFNQRVYLEICHENGDVDYQVVTTCENDATNDIMNGAYGQVYGSYISEPLDWDQNATYNIILECDDGTYRIPLEANVA